MKGGGGMAQRSEIESPPAVLPGVDRVKDYGPNGLQVEGRARLRHLVSGLTANLAWRHPAAGRFGAAAVAARLAATFGLTHQLIDTAHPAWMA